MSNKSDPFTVAESNTEINIETPKMFRLLLLNDDFTTFEFVVYVLMRFFHKSQEESEKITLKIHNDGQGIAGTFSRDEAETRILQVHSYSRKHNYPLMCKIEPE